MSTPFRLDDTLVELARKLKLPGAPRKQRKLKRTRLTNQISGARAYTSCEECVHLFQVRYQMAPRTVLAAALAHHRISLVTLARLTGYSLVALRDVLNGHRRITREVCFEIERVTSIPAQLLQRSDAEQNAEWFWYHQTELTRLTERRTQEFVMAYQKQYRYIVRRRGEQWYARLVRKGKVPTPKPKKVRRDFSGGSYFAPAYPPRMLKPGNKHRPDYLRSKTKTLRRGRPTQGERRDRVRSWRAWRKKRAAAYAIAMACGPRAYRRWGTIASNRIIYALSGTRWNKTGVVSVGVRGRHQKKRDE